MDSGYADSYRRFFDTFVSDRNLDSDPLTWHDTTVEEWLGVYRRWVAEQETP
jgi:hypothetical protein